MNFLIIEDETPAARRLKKLILAIEPQANFLAVLDGIEASVEWLSSHPAPDLIFMDIHLSDGPSFEIFKEIEVGCPIIFTTAYDEYAIQAFQHNSVDYLLKPIKREELARSIEKFKSIHLASKNIIDYGLLAKTVSQQTQQFQKRFVIRYGQHIKAINVADAAYFYIETKIAMLRTHDGKDYPMDYNLDQLEKMLDPSLFFRINRQFIISIHAIDQMYAYSKSRVNLTLNPSFEKETIVSTERSPNFKEWLKGLDLQ